MPPLGHHQNRKFAICHLKFYKCPYDVTISKKIQGFRIWDLGLFLFVPSGNGRKEFIVSLRETGYARDGRGCWSISQRVLLYEVQTVMLRGQPTKG